MHRWTRRALAPLLAGVCSLSACSADGFLRADGADMPEDAFVRRGLPPAATAEETAAAAAASWEGRPSVTVSRTDGTPPMMRLQLTDAERSWLEWGGTASCRVVLRLFRDAERGGEPVWRSDAGPGVGCNAGFADSAPAGSVARRFPVRSILGDSLEGGRYHATATVRSGEVARTVDAGSVFLWHDSLPPVADRDRIRWVVETAVVGTAPAELLVTVTATNSGRRRVRLAYDDCTLRMRLYRTPLRLLTVWSAEERAGRSADGCEGEPSRVVLAPGESFTSAALRVSATVPDILGDSLREGHYYVGAELALPRDDGGDDDGDGDGSGWARFMGGGAPDRDRVPLEAGVVELRGRRGQLGAERTVGGLTYRAASRVVRGDGGADTVRTAVVVTNTGGQRVVTAVLRDCPVLSYAYRDAGARDMVPMRDADWSPPVSRCGSAAHRFALDPGASWVFHADVPVESLAALLSAGPVHLTAVLRTPDRLVALAAGMVGGR